MKKINGMNDAAKKAYEGVQRAVRKQVVKAEDLVAKPAEDLLDKEAYMASQKFWNDPHNAAQYARGMYLAEIRECNPYPNKYGVIGLKGRPVVEYKTNIVGNSMDATVKDLQTGVRAHISHPHFDIKPQNVVIEGITRDSKPL